MFIQVGLIFVTQAKSLLIELNTKMVLYWYMLKKPKNGKYQHFSLFSPTVSDKK
jgi:hypothetical protein